jgi:hypothetical protein
MTSPNPINPSQAEAALAGVLKSQYHACLAMLQDAIEKCPESLWYDRQPTNAYWQVAYHALFFAHLYMGQDLESFVPWPEHQRDSQNEDGIAGPPDPTSTLPLIPRPYTKDQALRYWALCDDMVDRAVDALDLRRKDSGFHWYKMSKVEHQLVNLRHIQHHTAQLMDRLRAAENVGVKWVGAKRS